jgi:ureidoglycolate dehydrogenase (NAD+)
MVDMKTVMEITPHIVSEDALTLFVTELFAASGLPPADASLVARVLVWSNLRGVDSHGVLRIPGYLARVTNGINNPTPDMKVAIDLPAAAVLDADRAFGQVALSRAAEIATEKATVCGIGLCLIRETTHMGAVGYFTLEIAAEGMAGIAIAVSRPNMAYPGARTAGLATSPIAISVPGAEHAPLMLDMATATQSMGKIQLARDAGSALGEGWAIDADGNPTTDPNKAAIPTPLGGPKGGGLSLMFECLTSLTVGNPLIAPFIEDAPGGRRHMQNGLIIAIDVSKFGDVGDYAREIDRLTAAVKTLPRADGVDEILVPGERGDRVLEDRRVSGIPLPAGTWARLKEVAGPLGVAMPETS